MKVSYLELYNEEITDLLAVGQDTPKVGGFVWGRGQGWATRVCWQPWWAGGAAPLSPAAPPPTDPTPLPPAPTPPLSAQVRILEDRGGVVLAGIEEEMVKSEGDIFRLLEQVGGVCGVGVCGGVQSASLPHRTGTHAHTHAKHACAMRRARPSVAPPRRC